ncbi:Deleted in lung and esophageal cancer protein 1 [Phytophthora citrophthora]|uniref:Deleted in lung and esophageal cancer protein 1 n=1 Tax=Phytophthora citrophthora TaxID=4793 RepID=A0AAD9GNZ6_9STRA|nr:Deleted in lung and esophageal cancer protein 1 [Phytophthora citrophthora]
MAGAATKKASVAATAAAEAALVAEALEREAAEAAAALQAQKEAEEAAERVKKQQEQDELDVVAVGAVAHVIRRAFCTFYEPLEPVEQVAKASEENAAIRAENSDQNAPEEHQETVIPAKPDDEQTNSARLEPQETEESPFVAIAQARKDYIANGLQEKHQRARNLLKFMEVRQVEAAEVDKKIEEELSDRGLVIKAQIPVGPTHLRLDDQELRTATETGADFGEFADSLLHAKTLVAEYEQKRKEKSGNIKKAPSPTRRTAAGEESRENGEQIGYLTTTHSSTIRTETTLEQHKYHIAGVKALDASPSRRKMHQDRDNTSDLIDATLTSSSTTEMEEEPLQASRLKMNPVEKRKNMVILERMQTKLDFVRNPRYTVPEQSRSNGSVRSSSVKPCFDIVPKPPIMFTNYDIGGIYEQVVYVRNTGYLSRHARIIPPATIFFSMASISYPEERGLVAPGMHIELRIRFAPDSRADYKDSFTAQYETEQVVSPGATGTPGAAGSAELVVPLMARREPPELTLPLVIRAQNTLVGGRSVTPLNCRNLGGKARFWLMSESAWSQLENLQIGISPTRSAVELLNRDYALGTMDVGPFGITPNDIELDKGESVAFDLVYTPSGVGEQREKFVMVCDNCLVRVFQIVGRGCQVDVAATLVNDVPIESGVTGMGPLDRIFFPYEVLVNSKAQQSIVITNETPIDVKFSWKIQPVIEEAQTKVGKDKAMVLSLSEWSPAYKITPESGVFSLSSSKEFVVEFLPSEARTYTCQATLMINDVPACSMPGPDQMTYLKAAFQKNEDPPRSPRAAAKVAARTLKDAMPGFSMQLNGRGRLGSFAIIPALNDSWIPFEDEQQAGNAGCESVQVLQQRQKYSASVLLKNQCEARVVFSWDLSRLRQRHHAAGGGPSAVTIGGNSSSFELKLTPQTGELEALGQQRVELTFTPLCSGEFSVSVPCRIDTGGSARFERWLLLEGRVAGAEIEIVTPEVDFGLVLVGSSAETFVTIRNPSRSVTTHWRFLHLEGSDPGASQLPPGPKLRRSSSKESVVSRRSIVSSTSGNETERSLFTSRDILPRATIAFAPENGELAPGEKFTVRATCMAGSLPERFRGMFSCQAATERKFTGPNSNAYAVVSARAEIQCPNVFLSTTKLPLGTTYMGVEIHRTIELINVSNLEAAFKFVEPEGVSRAHTIAFSPKQGTIHSKERLVITLSYTPKQVGRFTVILACSVRGLPAPLGFEVSSNHKGLVLSYELVESASSLTLPKSPKEIALERGIPLSDCELEPETNPLSSIPKLAFGDNVPLGERRSLSLLLRNFSGIEALVDLEAKKFPAAAVNPALLVTSGDLSSSLLSPGKSRHKNGLVPSKSSRSLLPKGSYRTNISSLEKTSKSKLSDTKDDGNRFQSENGRTYLRQCSKNGEDRQVLRDGRGVAFQLSPSRVHIPPWEQVVVRVICFNNMPGTYVDDIVSRATGAPPVFLHANVAVVGSPLTLDRNCVGLYFGKPVKGKPQAFASQPALSFGSLCVRSPATTRTVRVVNRGPQRARLKWKLVENGRENQLVDVTLRVDFGSRLQLRIAPCDERNIGAALPFTVEPRSAMVPPFSTTAFRITCDPPRDGVAAPRALLLADAHWYDITEEHLNSESIISPTTTDPRHEDSSSPNTIHSPRTVAGKAFTAVRMANAMIRKPGPVAGSIPASSYSSKCLRVLLSADIIEPELSIDKPREQLQEVDTSPLTGRKNSIVPTTRLLPYHIKFTTWSTLMSASAAQHLFHRRELFLVNRLGSRVTFRLECDGPFAVAHADSLAPRHPLSLADLPPAHRRSTAQGESYMFMLPPQMSVRIDLRFLPAPLTDSSIKQPLEPLHTRFDGELRVKFSTKSVQTIRLAAVVLRPALVVSPSVFCFGRVHLSGSRFVVLRLANPTIVPARFTVQHVPRPKPISRAQQQEMHQHHSHLTDEPEVFTFSTLSGELCGPTTTLKSDGGYLPTTDSMRDLLENATTTHPLVHAPQELRVEFHPRESGRRYKSRFRFVVEHGRGFEVVLEGTGHLDEGEKPDSDRPLVRARELEHSYHIFRPVQDHHAA